MNYLEVSLSDLNEQCLTWANKIKDQCNVDLIIYIAKAGYIIGKIFSDVFDVPLVGIDATRKGNDLKTRIGPIISVLPNFIRNILITIELNSNTHAKDIERKASFHKGIETVDCNNIHSILIVDDSVDTGYSLQEVLSKVSERFENAHIYTAALNVWDKSESVIMTDFVLYRNTVLKTPMSKDSKEYRSFIKLYSEGTKDEYI